MGDNFIMRALKKHKQKESGIQSSQESSIDEDAYNKALNEVEGNGESFENKEIEKKWDWIISYYS
jgi:hypothetical protein